MPDLQDKVKDIIVEELGVEREKLTNEASFMEDLGADSLDTVELVMAFEKEFNIDIPDEDAEKMRTVGDAMQYLREKVKALEWEVSRQSATTWRRLGNPSSPGNRAPGRSRSSTRAPFLCASRRK